MRLDLCFAFLVEKTTRPARPIPLRSTNPDNPELQRVICLTLQGANFPDRSPKAILFSKGIKDSKSERSNTHFPLFAILLFFKIHPDCSIRR